jgi:hypothetical protein
MPNIVAHLGHPEIVVVEPAPPLASVSSLFSHVLARLAPNVRDESITPRLPPHCVCLLGATLCGNRPATL